jgi:hypothetical protein
LIAALDRRVPRVERTGEAAIGQRGRSPENQGAETDRGSSNVKSAAIAIA